MFDKKCEFFRGVTKIDDLPPGDLPEIAFVGRSNVGKSSLINALLHNRRMARTSNTPGRTQQLNFFNLDNKLVIVDLPGYGYAKASKVDIKHWNLLMDAYLNGRANLRRVFVLVDSRHGLKDNDRAMMRMLDDSAVAYQIVLTKSDKIKEKELHNVISGVKEELPNYTTALQDIVATSSGKGLGIKELRSLINKFL